MNQPRHTVRICYLRQSLPFPLVRTGLYSICPVSAVNSSYSTDSQPPLPSHPIWRMNRSPSPWGNRQTAPDLQPLVTVCNDSFRRAFAYSLDYLTGHHKSLVYLPSPPTAAALLTTADHLAYPVNKLSSSPAAAHLAASFATSRADQFVPTNALALALVLVHDLLVLAHDFTHTPT